MDHKVIPALLACVALVLLAWCLPPAAFAAGIFRDDFTGSTLDLNRWAVFHNGQVVVSNGKLTLTGGATELDRADVQSIQTFTGGVWRATITSSNWRPQSDNTSDSNVGLEFFTALGCHYGITVKSNGHLGVLEPVRDGGGVCSGDPARQTHIPISNWDNVRTGGTVHFRLSWRPIGLVLEASDGGANSGFAVYGAPLAPDANSPALPPIPLKVRLNADIAETFDVDFVEVREETVEFFDDFEVDRGWTIFEEPVNFNPCYYAGIGEIARSTDVAFSPTQSFRVWANATHTIYSNHIVAGNRIGLAPRTGVLRYELRAYIDPATAGSGQTGPEFSMQSTRQIGPGQFRTSTAGIQYRPALPPAERWAIWAEIGPGMADWVPLPELASFLLGPGKWYALSLEADYDTRAYRRFWVSGEGETGVLVDVSGFDMAEEQKPDFDSEGFSLTAESENLFTTCGGVFDYKMYYDDATLVALPAIFTDVPGSHPFLPWIETLFAAGITGGCETAPSRYCADALVTRGQMAVFLLRGIHGPAYDPPPPTGLFADVPADHPFAKWIEQLAREGITGGCAASPPQYCPDEGTTRGQMAVFLLRAEHGAGYDPPPPTGMFTDVPTNQPFAKWIARARGHHRGVRAADLLSRCRGDARANGGVPHPHLSAPALTAIRRAGGTTVAKGRRSFPLLRLVDRVGVEGEDRPADALEVEAGQVGRREPGGVDLDDLPGDGFEGRAVVDGGLDDQDFLRERVEADWRGRSAETFWHFASADRWSRFGRWGALEYQTQPRSEAPKFDAIHDFIEAIT